MAENITTSQVINEHCSCCHGNYYHSDVANGIWDRAREICENYCQIQLGSLRLNSAGPPPGRSLISYQIGRRIGMVKHRHPDVRVITGSWRSLLVEGWPYQATLISIISDIFLLVVVQTIICTRDIIVVTMLETSGVSVCLNRRLNSKEGLSQRFKDCHIVKKNMYFCFYNSGFYPCFYSGPKL